MLEKDIQNLICEYLQLKHYFFWRQNTTPVFNKNTGVYRSMPKFSMNGIPDIILIKDGIFWGLEVKTPKGKQSEGQKEFERRCNENKGEYHIVTSLEDVQSLGL